jgi:predicted enzyme related to lactoylglutathione lyase
MFTPKGKFGWYELMTSDTQAAAKFYSSVVGWTTKDVGNADMSYTTFNVGEYGVAGMLSLPQHTGWIGYIHVDDVDAHVTKIVEAGGKVWKPATDVPGMLRFAVMSDPQGAGFVVFTSNPAMPSPANPPKAPTPGTIGWHELYAADLEPAWDFYSKMFGWTIARDMDMGQMGIYRIFNEPENPTPMGAGGMMTKDPNVPNPVWGFYFNVDGIDAAIERINAAGGKILMGPHQVPGDSWIVMAQDPQGAKFNLVSMTK